MNDTTDTYEYRLSNLDPCIVQVRRALSSGRGALNWRTYMECDSPRRAAEVLARLRHQEPEAMVME